VSDLMQRMRTQLLLRGYRDLIVPILPLHPPLKTQRDPVKSLLQVYKAHVALVGELPGPLE